MTHFLRGKRPRSSPSIFLRFLPFSAPLSPACTRNPFAEKRAPNIRSKGARRGSAKPISVTSSANPLKDDSTTGVSVRRRCSCLHCYRTFERIARVSALPGLYTAEYRSPARVHRVFSSARFPGNA